MCTQRCMGVTVMATCAKSVAEWWKKKDSSFEPDYCAKKLDTNPWIVQPFEKYEEIKIEDLVKKHKK